MSKMKRVFGRSNVFWGIALIASAVVLLLNGLFGDIPIVSLLIGIFAVSWIISEIVKGNPQNIFIPAAILFCALQRHISGWLGYGGEKFISTWIVILAAILLQIGVRILMPRGRNWKRFIHNTGNTDVSAASQTSSGEDFFENDMGASTYYVDAARLGTFRLSNDLGKLDVYIENPEMYAGGGTLVVSNDLGQMNIHIPTGWGVINKMQMDLGAVNCSVSQDGSPLLTVEGTCDLGNVNIM